MQLDVRGLTPLLQIFDMPRSIRFYRDGLGFGMRQMDLHDPDGYLLCFQWPA